MDISLASQSVKKAIALFLSLIVALCVITPFSLVNARAAEYVPRMSAPSRSSKYYTSGNPYYTTGYGMPNCTCYAWGRAYEILGKKPNLPVCNAGQWYGRNKSSGAYPYGSRPQLGAIACWGHHVAVVEQIEGNTVTISESHYSGRYFDTHNLTRGRESSYAGTFYGYIYVLVNGAGTSPINLDNYIMKPGWYRTDTEGKNLNIRAGRGTNTDIIGKIPSGTKINVTEVKNDWGHVVYDGVDGWVSMAWVENI